MNSSKTACIPYNFTPCETSDFEWFIEPQTNKDSEEGLYRFHPFFLAACCNIIMKLYGMWYEYIFEMYILSGIYVWTKIIEMMGVELWHFSAKLEFHALSATPPQQLPRLLWNLIGVRLPYWNVHIVRNLCLK